jgi:hypothetical protein
VRGASREADHGQSKGEAHGPVKDSRRLQPGTDPADKAALPCLLSEEVMQEACQVR